MSSKTHRDDSDLLPLARTADRDSPRRDFPRRDFLKVSGFLFAGSAIGCSRAPVPEALPLLTGTPEMVPGRSTWYASTCGACTAGCGAIVRSRDGRPLKMEGNTLHTLSQGGLCAVGQASLLEFYDSQRLRQPLLRGKTSTWAEVDSSIKEALTKANTDGRAVRLLSETVHSPSELAAIASFSEDLADFRHITYDPLSCSAILDAHAATHGVRVLPHYRFAAAEVLVSFDADFSSTWISPVEFTADYSAGRDLSGKPPRMSHHLQVESRLSLSGSNADERLLVDPTELSPWMAHLAQALAGFSNNYSNSHSDDALNEVPAAMGQLSRLLKGEAPPQVAAVAERLWQARGHALVVCGSQDLGAQILCNLINHLLGNYGHTLDIERPSKQKQGDDRALAELRQELADGQVEVLIIRGVNPVYDLPGGQELEEMIAQVPMSVSLARAKDETTDVVMAICPEHHFLEDWRDAEPVAGKVSLTQPLIQPLGETRGFSSSLLAWSGAPRRELDWLQEVWRRQILPRSSASQFRAFWDQSLHDGFITLDPSSPSSELSTGFALSALEQIELMDGGERGADSLSLLLYPKAGMLDGRHAHNAWLQEMPDPVSKVSWDNYACLAPEKAAELGIEEGDLVRISGSGGGKDLLLPALLQRGQHPKVVAVALGYGRAGTDRFSDVGPTWFEGKATVEPGETVGTRVAGWLQERSGQLVPLTLNVKLSLAGGHRALAKIQVYEDLEVPEKLRPVDGQPRPIVQQTSLAGYAADPAAGKPHHHFPQANLWPEYPVGKHRWGMSIDLNACTGCSACVIACQVENNVPVVGRDEVRRRRDLYWMRIDRYYSGSGEAVEVAHQPMLCHHCDNAPCESVCPVLATVHSEEGLNQQVYNRCVGTRYCANNCPYKVRRFNWFNYPHEDSVANLALNPDVTVRSRGVMEKCSFCVQRIQEAKISAKSRGEAMAPNAVEAACQQSCPAGAIIFGDLADPKSEIAEAVSDPRHYRLFEELNILPSVGYKRLVRNRPDDPSSTPLESTPLESTPSGSQHPLKEEEKSHGDSHG